MAHFRKHLILSEPPCLLRFFRKGPVLFTIGNRIKTVSTGEGRESFQWRLQVFLDLKMKSDNTLLLYLSQKRYKFHLVSWQKVESESVKKKERKKEIKEFLIIRRF